MPLFLHRDKSFTACTSHRRGACPLPLSSSVAISLPFGLTAGKGVSIADVNLDGRADLVTTAESQREAADMIAVAWKENTPDGWIDHAISDQHGRKFDRLEMLDLDGDGDLDLLTCEEVDNLGVFWYENPTRK